MVGRVLGEEEPTTEEEFIRQMAPLVREVIASGDSVAESQLNALEEKAEHLFPKRFKHIQATALNLAMGHKATK